MQYYSYKPSTGEYIGSAEARQNPREKGKYLLPAFATFDEPQPAVGIAAVWNGSKWDYIEDYRGTAVYHKTNGNAGVVRKLGPISSECTTAAPPEPVKYYKWGGNNWVLDTSQKQEIIKLLEARIDKQTDEKILNDFVYDGNAYYLSLENQMNFKALNDIRDSLTYPVKVKHQSGYAEIATAEDYHGFYLAGMAFIQLAIKNGWNEKDALQDKTTEQLIEILNQGE